MTLKAASLMFLKHIFIIIVVSIAFIVNFCQIYMSFVERSTHFLENLQHRITTNAKLFILLLLKIMITISRSIQNSILEICDILARATLNSNDQILLVDNSKNNHSFAPGCNSINENRDEKEHCFGNCNHVVKNAIFISNLPSNTSVTMMLDPNETANDNQDSFSKLCPNYCSSNKTADDGKVSDSSDNDLNKKDLNIAFESAENQISPERRNRLEYSVTPESCAIRPNQPTVTPGMISTKYGVVNVEHSSLADYLDFKEKTLIENTKYPLKRIAKTYMHSCTSSNAVSEKQMVESKIINSDNKLKTIVNERNIAKNKYKFFDEEKLKEIGKIDELLLLRRHRLISDENSSEDLSEKSKSCGSIIEACSTSLVNKTKSESSNSSEDLNTENIFGNNFPACNYCQKDEKSDSVLNYNKKSNCEIDLWNGYSLSNKFDAENIDEIQESKPSMYIEDLKSITKTKFKNQNEIKRFSMKNAYAKCLHFKNLYNEFAGNMRRVSCDSRKIGSNETTSEDLQEELANQPNENTKDDKSCEVIRSAMDELLALVEKEYNLFPPKDITTEICSWQHNDIIKVVGGKVNNSVNSLETKARNYDFKDVETGEITLDTNAETSMHRTLPSERQSTVFQMKALNNSAVSVQESINGLSTDNSSRLIYENNFENKLDVPENSVFNYVKTGKNIDNKETIKNEIDTPLLWGNGYHDSYKCGTNTKNNDKILNADECVKFLKILQSLYPNEKFQLDTEIACKDNVRKSELIKTFYKNKLEMDNKISMMLETFEDLKSMTTEEYDSEMKEMFENTDYLLNKENMLDCVNLYLLGPTYLEESSNFLDLKK